MPRADLCQAEEEPTEARSGEQAVRDSAEAPASRVPITPTDEEDAYERGLKPGLLYRWQDAGDHRRERNRDCSSDDA
jgi:hypothetical protein